MSRDNSGSGSSYTTIFGSKHPSNSSVPRLSNKSEEATLHCSTLLKTVAENYLSNTEYRTIYEASSTLELIDAITYDIAADNRETAITQLAHSIIRIDITDAKLDSEVEKFFQDVALESKKLPFHPFRISHRVPADLEKIKKFREQKNISELIITGKITRKFNRFDASNCDLSFATFEKEKILASMNFFRTKLSRAQFFYLIKQKILATKLNESCSSIDLSCADISGVDLREIPIRKILFNAKQNFTGCIITVKQANYLAQAGMTTLSSAVIVESPVIKKDDAAENLLEASALAQHAKITINAEGSEKIFTSNRFQDVDLTHYQMTRPELEKIIKKMRETCNPFHWPEYADRLAKFISFLQQESKKYNIKKMVISNISFKENQIDAFDFSSLVMRNCIFDKVDFNQARCSTAQFQKCVFRQCNFNGICISNHTEFDRCDYQHYERGAGIESIHYEYHQSDGKITTAPLQPKQFYENIQTAHANKIVQENKIKWFHRFFHKTDQELGRQPKRFFCLFPSLFANKSRRFGSLEAFQGMMKINQHINKKTNLTSKVVREYFEKQSAQGDLKLK